MMRVALTCFALTVLACTERPPTTEHELPIECLPFVAEPAPPDDNDDVLVDTDIVSGDPITTLWPWLPSDPDCTARDVTFSLSEYPVRWRRAGVTHRSMMRLQHTVRIRRQADTCMVSTTHDFFPDLAQSDGIRNGTTLRIGLCDAWLRHRHWASLQTAQIRMTAFAVGDVFGADIGLPVSRVLPWRASPSRPAASTCNNAVSAVVPDARLSFSAILSFTMPDWLRVQSTDLPLAMAHISIDVR